MLKHASLHAGRAALAVVVFATCAGAGEDPKQGTAPANKAASREKVSGVILRAERLAEGDDALKTPWRLTINTDVVWLDFVRDQAVEPKKATGTGIAKAATKGKNSVATKGHPSTEPLLVVMDLDPKTEISIRYRSSTDASGEGAPTPDGAFRAEKANEETGKGKAAGQPAGAGGQRQAPKARTLEPMELKAGLWVDVEFREVEGRNQARRITVLRPVRADAAPDKDPIPATKSTNPGR